MNFSQVVVAMLALLVATPCAAQDLLPSWNDGPAKKAILEFVAAVTDEKRKDYVEPADRVATFDNDGTLWVEYPMYTQALFAFDRVKELAPQHPEWKTQQPFKGVMEDDMKAVDHHGWKMTIAERRRQPRRHLLRRHGHIAARDRALRGRPLVEVLLHERRSREASVAEATSSSRPAPAGLR
jgi:hypothetical protein